MYRKLNPLRNSIIVVTTAVALTPHTVAARDQEGYVVPSSSTGELFGMEIEIAGSRSLSGILNLFDLDLSPVQTRIARTRLSVADLDAYLTPANLDSLDPAVKAQLTENLVIKGEVAMETNSTGFSHHVHAPSRLHPRSQRPRGGRRPSRGQR